MKTCCIHGEYWTEQCPVCSENARLSESPPTPCSTPAQYWRESCLADRGYRFIRWDGDCTVWQLRGVTPNPICTVKVTPAGDTVDVSNPRVDVAADEQTEKEQGT